MGNQNDEEVEFKLKWFDIVMEEYNSLRNESAEALRQQQSIINYGLTAIGVLIAFSANLWGKEKIVESIYVLFIPFMCNVIILIWNGEIRRMSRAGQYIKELETKINNEFPNDKSALGWESYLRQPKDIVVDEVQETNWLKRTFKWIEGIFSFLFQKDQEKNNKIKSNYIAIILMFCGLSLFSILLGFVHSFSMYSKEYLYDGYKLFSEWIASEFIWLIIYTIILVVDTMFFIYHYRYFQRVKK